jgi:hypothetical protein
MEVTFACPRETPLTALTRFFFRAPYQAPDTTWSVVRWWESRRLAYNASVGVAGLLSLGAMTLAELLPPVSHDYSMPWAGVVVWGIGANIFYCLGPALDALICRKWGADYAAVGPALFRYGYAFAVGLTLMPIPLAVFFYVTRLLGFLWGGAPPAPV